MAKKTAAKAGDFIEITARKVSDKVQPEIKVGGIYHVNRVEQLKSGATVLVIDKDRKKNKTVRCNAERFTWEVRTPPRYRKSSSRNNATPTPKHLWRASLSRSTYR